ncbi:Eco57I restriction-modification methylase domain-containing protein [Clostridium algidicarnis]|uniref:Eco57I restriction-modification methylase domain-containing protein n=1 Tax=Clostridium algidicarnis TaxID=37659 RepID=UPI001C0D46B2|nr:DNA methyltransferase [Clostridium algidicarnis]MBU3209647.1 Eco57I restriction-modification methylase domain-containing protein [Clostridium algidicarnis]
MENIKIELQKLVNKFEKDYNYYKDSHKYNENNCRLEFIDEFFKILGWDISNEQCKPPQFREVITENYQADTGRPDYSMTLNGVHKFHVEAKKPSVSIEQHNRPAIQARSYGWNSNLRISVLTNFEYLIIYDTSIPPKENDEPKTAAIKMYNYKEYVDKIEDIYNIISKKAVYSGEFESVLDINGFKVFDKGLQLPVDEYFLNSINRWRVNIGDFLYKTKGYAIEIINDYIQEFINQIIFLRICEDRKLPIYHKLKEILEEKKLIEEMDKLFREADKKYNSGLFKNDNILFDLNNEIIREIVEELYYPKSPYVFNLIKPNILGEIYELFLAEQLAVDNGQVVLQGKDKNLHRDVVTTPLEIVKYMVNGVLSEYCKNKGPREILQLKVADIACGSGIFLIETYDWIIRYETDWYIKNDINHLICNGKGDYKLPFEDKKDILEKCIWGIDVDIHAVEVAKFNLVLKLLESETESSLRGKERLLPGLEDNIKYGNSLIDFQNINYSKLTQLEKRQIVAFNWDNINNGQSFDVIIGNPPYVSTENMNNLLNKKEVKVYKDKYNTSKGQFDKYFIFVERALEKIKDNGIVSYIIPNKFTKIKAGEALRDILSRNRYVKEYIDFGSLQLFKDRNKTVYSSILLLQKSNQSKLNYVEVDNISKWYSNTESKEVKVDSNVLGSLPWALVADENEMSLINKIYKNSTSLGNEVEVFNGIQTSAERPPIYWFSAKEVIEENNSYFKIKKLEKEYIIEKEILKRYFKPVLKSEKNLGSYDIYDTDKYIIFPYNSDGKLYDLKTMESMFPNTLEYLKDNYEELKPKQIGGIRRDVPLATEETWYQYGRDQALTAFNNKIKLIVGVLSKKAMYLYDDNNFVIASGGTAGYCAMSEKIKSNYKIEFIQAYLTHPYSEKLLSIIGSDFEGDYYSRGTNILVRFPLKMINFNDSYQLNLYNSVVANVRRIHEVNKLLKGNLSKSYKNVLIDEKEYLINDNEKLITTIYNL